MARRKSTSANTPWSDEELRASVATYVLLLRLKAQGHPDRIEPVAQAILGGSLGRRNEAAIRYRMRNISAVARDLNGPILDDFSPAESVGTIVRVRIRTLLLEEPDFVRMVARSSGGDGQPHDDALDAVRVLRERVEELEAELAWRGHNGPPDWDPQDSLRASLRATLADVALIEGELRKPRPDVAHLQDGSKRFMELASGLAKWLGARTTKFVDAALVAAAPLMVAKVAGLLPTILSAVEAIARIAHP